MAAENEKKNAKDAASAKNGAGTPASEGMRGEKTCPPKPEEAIPKPEIKPVASSATADPTPTIPEHSPVGSTPPKKGRRSCLVIVGIIVFLYIVLQFVPVFGFGLFGLFGGKDFTYVPVPNSNNSNQAVTNQNINTAQSNQNKNSTTKSKNTNSSSGGGAETPTPPPDGPVVETPASTGQSGPQTSFTKEEEINYFIKISITDERHDFAEIPLKKWTYNDVSIRYFNNPTGSDLACADETINIINSLSTTTHYTKTDGGLYYIEVHFVPFAEIAANEPDALGYVKPTTFTNSAMAHVKAYVPIDTYPDSVRCHTIRHEMTHAMTGLLYNLSKPQGGYHYSIFNVAVEGWTEYLNIDKDLIKMMLNTATTPGMSAAQAREMLNNASW